MILILLFIMHSICPKFALISQIYHKFAIFVSFRQKFSSYFQNGTIFLVILKENICLQWFQAKMQPVRQQVEWMRQIFAQKLPKRVNIPIYNFETKKGCVKNVIFVKKSAELGWIFSLWKIYQNVKKSSSFSKIVNNNAKLFI